MLRSLIPLLFFLSGTALAQQSLPSEPFAERPGVLEFSGRMILSPVPVDAHQRAGFSRAQAESRRQWALADLSQYELLEAFPEVDQYVVRIPAGFDENSFADLLRASGHYGLIEPDWLCYPIATPNDPLYGQQWHHDTIQSAAAWNVHTGDSNYIAAFVDTGVDLDHEDLEGALIPGFNSATNQTQTNGGNLNDVNGHGTAVAGCIGAIGNNGAGVAGVCWDVSLLPIRATNSSDGTALMSNLAQGARWAAENGAGSVSVSYSGVSSSGVLVAGNYCELRDCVLLWAAGNENRGLSLHSDWESVVVVGATNQSDVRAGFSNYGRPIDVVAPGVSIRTTSNGGGYTWATGTSFAAPLTNGVVAMMRIQFPSANAVQIRLHLDQTADDLGAGGEDDTYGHGRVNLEQALGGTPPPPPPPPALELVGENLQAGELASLFVFNATPFDLAYLYYSAQGPGSTALPQYNVTLDIANARSLAELETNGIGAAVLDQQVPPRFSGRTVWLQACEVDRTTEVLEVTL